MNNPLNATQPQYDPTLPDVVRDPYPSLLALQDHDPAHWSPRLKAWVLTRYDDVKAALTSSDMSVDRIRPFYESLPAQEQSVLSELMRYLTLWLVFRDPPEHTRLRQLMGRAFCAPASRRSAIFWPIACRAGSPSISSTISRCNCPPWSSWTCWACRGSTCST